MMDSHWRFFCAVLVIAFALDSLLPGRATHAEVNEYVANVDVGHVVGPFKRIHDMATCTYSSVNNLPFELNSYEFDRWKAARFTKARAIALSWGGTSLRRDEDGKLIADFSHLDRVLDVYRAAGAKVLMRIAYTTPPELRPSHPDRPYAGVDDLEEWEQLVHDVVHHVNVEKGYGVKDWVMYLNEANYNVMDRKDADMGEMHAMYERAVRGGLRADPTIKVGGPALAYETYPPIKNTYQEFMRSFLAFVRERDLPLDFICYHYGARFQPPYRYSQFSHPRSNETLARELQALGREYLPDRTLQYFQDEFAVLTDDERQDSEFAAAYLAASLHYMLRGGVDQAAVFWFTFSCPLHEAPRDLVGPQTGFFDTTGPELARFKPAQVSDGATTRRAILTHPPTYSGLWPHSYTYGRFRVMIPSDTRPALVFATAIDATAPKDSADGAAFSVVVKETSDEEKVVFSHLQQPDAKWTDHHIDLGQFAGQSVDIELRTDPGHQGNNRGDAAAWGELRLIDTDNERVFYDFAEKVGNARTGALSPGYTFTYDLGTILYRYWRAPLLKGPVVTTPYFVFYAYSQLMDDELSVRLEKGSSGITADDSAGIIATSGENEVALLLWRFDPSNSDDRPFVVRLSGLARLFGSASQLSIERYLIDRTHSNSYYDYFIAKKPTNGGRYNQDSATLEKVEELVINVDTKRSAQLRLSLPSLSVTLVRVSPSH